MKALLVLLLVAAVAHAKPPAAGRDTLKLADAPPTYHRAPQQPVPSCTLVDAVLIPDRLEITYSSKAIVVNGEAWGDGGFTPDTGAKRELTLKIATDPTPGPESQDRGRVRHTLSCGRLLVRHRVRRGPCCTRRHSRIQGHVLAMKTRRARRFSRASGARRRDSQCVSGARWHSATVA